MAHGILQLQSMKQQRNCTLTPPNTSENKVSNIEFVTSTAIPKFLRILIDEGNCKKRSIEILGAFIFLISNLHHRYIYLKIKKQTYVAASTSLNAPEQRASGTLPQFLLDHVLSCMMNGQQPRASRFPS